ncbi:MAG: hypothetical protein ACTMIR_07825 [Cellulomonadaceae bacterium]
MHRTTWLTATAISLAGFLGGEYGAGAILTLVRDSAGNDVMLRWVWLPWILAPLLGTVLAAFVVPAGPAARLWHWSAVVLPVPVGAFVVTAVVAGGAGVGLGAVALASTVQIALAAGVGHAIGWARMVRARDAAAVAATQEEYQRWSA